MQNHYAVVVRLSCALVLLTTIAAAQSAPPAAPQYDKAFLLKYLQETRQKFLDSFASLSEAQFKFKPAPDRWSVAEVAEHVTLAEQMLGGMIIERIMKSAFDPAKKKEAQGKEAEVLKVIPDRRVKAQAPDELKPTGRWTTRAELVQVFEQTRAKNARYTDATAEEMRNHFGLGPMGTMDAYQWMLFLAAHSARHTAQIEEVKTDPNFPKS